jgi:hypothetical protein
LSDIALANVEDIEQDFEGGKSGCSFLFMIITVEIL